MLPPGHIAAGFLTAKVLLHFTHPPLPEVQQVQLLWWGAFFGFAPDLDMFLFFIKNKTLLVANRDAAESSHRKFLTHAPLYWLFAGLLIFFFSPSVYWKYVGLLLWLGSWSHFLLDSIEFGIPWLRPFTNKFFALKDREYKVVIKEQGFFRHSFAFLKMYCQRISFYLEVAIIVSAIIIYFR